MPLINNQLFQTYFCLQFNTPSCMCIHIYTTQKLIKIFYFYFFFFFSVLK